MCVCTVYEVPPWCVHAGVIAYLCQRHDALQSSLADVQVRHSLCLCRSGSWVLDLPPHRLSGLHIDEVVNLKLHTHDLMGGTLHPGETGKSVWVKRKRTKSCLTTEYIHKKD